MATTSKILVSPGLLKEAKLDFQRKIKGIQSRHNIPNHWSNEDKKIQLLSSVIFPFVAKQREESQLPLEEKAMLMFDVFKGETSDAVLKVIEDNNCLSVLYQLI